METYIEIRAKIIASFSLYLFASEGLMDDALQPKRS